MLPRKHAVFRNILDLPYRNIKLATAGISTTLMTWNYYEALGIPRNSTQNDIKAAYYKLSMQFHPDKNQGCESAARKFREITRAYEVLGNYRLRRMYDKGIIHSTGYQQAQAEMTKQYPEDIPEDPQTKFYKSRFKKSAVSDMTGRTPIYNFDEWSRAHYGEAFRKRQDAKVKWENKEKQKKNVSLGAQKELLLFGTSLLLIMMYMIFMMESSYDAPNQSISKQDGKKKHS